MEDFDRISEKALKDYPLYETIVTDLAKRKEVAVE